MSCEESFAAWATTLPGNDQTQFMDCLASFFEWPAERQTGRQPCRSIALFSLEHDGDSRGSESTGRPVAGLFTGERHRSYYERRPASFPRIEAGRVLSGPPEMFSADACGEPPVEIVRSLFFTIRFPQGQSVGALALEWFTDDLREVKPVVDLRWALDNGRRHLAAEFGSPLNLDFHQVLLLSGTQVQELEEACRAPGETDLAGFHDLLQGYMSSAGRSNRVHHLTAHYPSEPNRYQHTAAALVPGASVIGGQSHDNEVSMVLAAAQALAGLATIRRIHDQASLALEAVPTDTRSRFTLLQEVANTVSRLELDLGFGVEAQLSIRIRVPLLPIEQYYECLVGLLGMQRAVDITSEMLNRLMKVLLARQAEAEARRATVVGAVGWALSVATGVALPLTLILAFEGSNVRQALTTAQAPQAYSVFDLSHFGVYYLALFSPVILGIAAGLVVLWIYRSNAGARRRDR
jgi:hypothetical protein